MFSHRDSVVNIGSVPSPVHSIFNPHVWKRQSEAALASAWALGPKSILIEKYTGYALYIPFLWWKIALCQFQVKETTKPTNKQTSTPLPTTLSFFGLSLYASFVTVEKARCTHLPSISWLFNWETNESLNSWLHSGILLINKKSSILTIYYISVLTFWIRELSRPCQRIYKVCMYQTMRETCLGV